MIHQVLFTDTTRRHDVAWHTTADPKTDLPGVLRVWTVSAMHFGDLWFVQTVDGLGLKWNMYIHVALYCLVLAVCVSFHAFLSVLMAATLSHVVTCCHNKNERLTSEV